MAVLKHELWSEPGGEMTLCLAGPRGAGARGLLAPGSEVTWTTEAGSHFEAMTKYYAHLGWGEYTTEFAADKLPYPDEWAIG